jgi:hypothetical protein
MELYIEFATYAVIIAILGYVLHETEKIINKNKKTEDD